MKRLRKAVYFLTALVLIWAAFSGCSPSSRDEEIIRYASYKEVPGITEEEISAIEAFQKEGETFIFGTLESTETFFNENGELSGFTVLFCEWLQEIFGAPFIPTLYEWDELLAGLESGEIDFTGELTATPERRETYFMTDTIANRFVSYFRILGAEPLKDIEKKRLPRYGFLLGATTYNDARGQTGGNFDHVFAENYDEAYALLLSGEIDAFIEEQTAEAAFARYDNITAEPFFPLLFGPVSLTTQKARNIPIISVTQKILASGGIRLFVELYNKGESEYSRHKLIKQLTEEEREYLRVNSVIKFAAEHDNYPMSFFNNYDNEFQGICFDIIKEMEKYTGLKFEPLNNQYDDWAVILKMLEEGRAAFLTELIYLPEREEYFIWPDEFYSTDYHALISKEEHRNININEIMYTRVGLVEGYAQTELFYKWFPDHAYTKVYDSFTKALDALGEEIDMVMGSQNQLSVITIFNENPGYKANLVFDYPYGSTFGFNKDEEILCSIFNKALRLIDTQNIEKQWKSRTYDYRMQIARARFPLLIGAIGLLFCVLALVSFLFYRSKKYAKIREESKFKSIFLANMSHEIRTPMNAINGMAELVLRNEINPQVRDYMLDIKQAGNNLISIINDILDISKIEAGKMEIIPVNYLLSSLLYDALALINVKLKDKPVTFITDIDESLPNRLLGDEMRLRQIIINLLSNAVKYTEKGEIKFRVKAEKLDEKKVWLKITVADTGRGIKPEDQAKLFNKFVQVDKERNLGIEGTGLGLAIAKQLCEAMGGSISMHSEYGKGSEFSVIIPQEIISAEPIGPFENAARSCNEETFEITHIFPNSRILVVDDLPANLKVAEGLLAPYKAVVDVCASGAEAVELVKYKKFDLIFMDHMMTEMDGIEAVRLIREWEKDIARNNLRRIPIVALTANALAGVKDHFIKNGFDDFLAKPINVILLDEILNRWIEKKEKTTGVGAEQGLIRDEAENKNGGAPAKLSIKESIKKNFSPAAAALLPVKRNYKRALLGLFILSFGIVLGVTIAAQSLIAFAMRTMEYNIEQRLVTIAEMLADFADAEELESYKEPQDMELPSYKELRLKLLEFSEKTDVLYVYFMRPGDRYFTYIVDNDFDEETRVGLDTPPDYMSDFDDIIKTLNGETVYAGLGNYTTGWDGLLSAYAPVYNSEGKITIVAGVDIIDTAIVQAQRRLNALTAVQIIMALILFITAMFAIIRFRKEAETAEKATAIKDDFLSKMSYELLNPMHTISGLTELALRSDLSFETRELLHDIREAGANLTSIIKDILYFSETGLGKSKQAATYSFPSLFKPISYNGKKDAKEEIIIKGVDTVKGISMTGKTAEKYKEVLAVFNDDLKEKLPFLENIPSPEDTAKFVSCAHALKSALATIGAEELSRLAAEFEEAGNAGNIGLIKEKLPIFRALLKELIENINNVIMN